MKSFLKFEEYQKNLENLIEIFDVVEENQKKLIQGLLEETAYMKTELSYMRTVLGKTGMIKIHPTKPELQKQLPIANEYRRTVNAYSLNIKALNSILNKNVVEEEDAFDKWVSQKMNQDD